MKPLTFLIACGCAAVALVGCGSSSGSDEPSPSPAAKEATPSASDRAAAEVCSARDDIQAQAQTLSSLTADTATRAGVTAALTAIQADLQKIKAAQPSLSADRKQQVQDAATAFETQLKDIVQQAIAGLGKSDAAGQAKQAADSLESAVKESLEPIDCS